MKYVIVGLGVIALIVLVSLLLVYPVMWGINYLFTSQVLLALFGVAKMTFWKTFVLELILGVLFKNTSVASKQ